MHQSGTKLAIVCCCFLVYPAVCELLLYAQNRRCKGMNVDALTNTAVEQRKQAFAHMSNQKQKLMARARFSFAKVTRGHLHNILHVPSNVAPRTHVSQCSCIKVTKQFAVTKRGTQPYETWIRRISFAASCDVRGQGVISLKNPHRHDSILCCFLQLNWNWFTVDFHCSKEAFVFCYVYDWTLALHGRSPWPASFGYEISFVCSGNLDCRTSSISEWWPQRNTHQIDN